MIIAAHLLAYSWFKLQHIRVTLSSVDLIITYIFYLIFNLNADIIYILSRWPITITPSHTRTVKKNSIVNGKLQFGKFNIGE